MKEYSGREIRAKFTEALKEVDENGGVVVSVRGKRYEIRAENFYPKDKPLAEKKAGLVKEKCMKCDEKDDDEVYDESVMEPVVFAGMVYGCGCMKVVGESVCKKHGRV